MNSSRMKNLQYGWFEPAKGLTGVLDVEITGKVDLGKLKPSMKTKLINALKDGVAPVEYSSDGKLATLYRVVSNAVELPKAYLSTASGLLCVEDVDDELYEELKALWAITKTTERHGYRTMLNRTNNGMVTEYRCEIPIQLLQQTLNRHRPPDEEKLQRAITAVREGAVLTMSSPPIQF